MMLIASEEERMWFIKRLVTVASSQSLQDTDTIVHHERRRRVRREAVLKGLPIPSRRSKPSKAFEGGSGNLTHNFLICDPMHETN
jgi:hypothetical protein